MKLSIEDCEMLLDTITFYKNKNIYSKKLDDLELKIQQELFMKLLNLRKDKQIYKGLCSNK